MAFEGTSRLLATASGDRNNPHLWQWSGQGGWAQGLSTSLVTFGMLKSAGYAAREQNVILQHLFSDFAMVGGHQVTGALGWTPHAEGTLAEQLLHAEVTNLQLGAGMSLLHTAAPGLAAFERGLDLSLQAMPVTVERRRGGSGLENLGSHSFAFAMPAGGEFLGTPETVSETVKNSNILMMEGNQSGNGNQRETLPGNRTRASSFRSYQDVLRERLGAISAKATSEVEAQLTREWEQWKHHLDDTPSLRDRVEQLLPHYARWALAHLGRDTPAHLPFLQEVYDMSSAALSVTGGGKANGLERNALLRFLSNQPGRRNGEFVQETASRTEILPSRLTMEEAQAFLGPAHEAWETFLKEESRNLSLPPSEEAQVYQRGLSLMHFYAAYLHARTEGILSRPFGETALDLSLLQHTLQDSSQHPYPTESIALFGRFFREKLGQADARPEAIQRASLLPAPLELDALPLQGASLFSPPNAGENWGQYLTRVGITRGLIDAAELGIAGATVFTWGSRKDGHQRLSPPGEILHALGIFHFINAQGEGYMDPFDAIRLTLPEQLQHFRPNEDGEIVIRFPKLMADLDYAHFNLGSLLRAYLQSTPEAHDIDLARQWGVSESTVSEYRRGVIRKMRMDTLDRLSQSLVPEEAGEEKRQEMLNLLMFLRYRPYFDATMTVQDRDENLLNRRPPFPSRARIVLEAHGDTLRPLDLTRRVRFEREPFASALDGTVDLSLALMEQKAAEFEVMGRDCVELAEGPILLNDFSNFVRRLRFQHTRYFQTLSQQAQRPGVVKPGELREIQEFYRELFRIFERVHLHTRPEGTLSIEGAPLRFEIVPPTVEQSGGVRWLPDPQSPGRLKGFVVAADLLRRAQALSPSVVRDLISIRLLESHLRESNLLLSGEANAESNRRILDRALSEIPRTGENPEHSWGELMSLYERLEKESQGEAEPLIHPGEQAVLHRVTRGKLSQTALERRLFFWQEDLQHFALAHQIGALAPSLEAALNGYLEKVPHPYQRFDDAHFQSVIRNVENSHGREQAREVGERLKVFMKTMGLPTETNGASVAPLTLEGFSNSTFANYLTRYREHHPLRWQGAITEDGALLDRIIEDRLADFPHLAPQKDRIRSELGRLIEEYNRREPPLRIYEISGSETGVFSHSPLETLFETAFSRWVESRGGASSNISPRWIYAALRELEPSLRRGEIPTEESSIVALHRARERFSRLGITESTDEGLHGDFLASFLPSLRLSLAAVDRLSLQVAPFIEAKRFCSGLDHPLRMAQDMTEIFRNQFRRALFQPAVPALKETILGQVRERFEAYASIQEDVVRGMSALYGETISHFRNRYSLLQEALNLSRELNLESGNAESFWADFLSLASQENPSLKTREDLIQSTEDLETLFSLLSGDFSSPVSNHVRETLREMEENRARESLREDTLEAASPAEPPPPDPVPEVDCMPDISIAVKPANLSSRPPAPITTPPPLDIASVLEAPVPADRLERYPELSLVTEEGLVSQITEERRAFVQSEGRSLLQLFALLDRYEPGLSAELREKISGFLLETETMPGEMEVVTDRAFEAYDAWRSQFLEGLPVLDRIGALPEVREGDFALQGAQAGRALQSFLSRRRLKGEWNRFWMEQAEKNFDDIQRGDLDPFFNAVGQFYLNHRDDVRNSPPLPLKGEEVKALDLTQSPPSQRQRIDLEAPELNLFGDADLREALEISQRSQEGTIRDFWSQDNGYLLLKLRCLLATRFHPLPTDSPLIKFGTDLLRQYRQLTALAMTGVSLPHLMQTGTDRMMEEYQRNRPAVLSRLIETDGLPSIVGTFPEIASQPIRPLAFQDNNGTIVAPRLESLERAAQTVNRIFQSTVNSRHRRAIEQMLWSFEPPSENASAPEVEERIGALADKILRYYLDHRGDMRNAPRSSDLPNLERIRTQDEEEMAPYWETDIYPASSVRERQQKIRLFLRQPAEGNPTFLVRYLSPEGDSHETILPQEQAESVLEAFSQGRSVRFSENPDLDVTPELHVASLPVTSYVRMRMFLQAFSSFPLFRFIQMGYFFSRSHPALHQTMERDFHRAASFLLMGIHPGWVLPELRNRMMRNYDKNRDDVLNHLDFYPYASSLPEVGSIPTYAVEAVLSSVQEKFARDYPRETFDFPKDGVSRRIQVLFSHSQISPPLRAVFLRDFLTPRKRIENNLERRIAQFYVEHRAEILPYVRTWPEEADPAVFREISQLPELESLDHDQAMLSAVHLPHSLAASKKENELLLKITHLVYQDGVPPSLQSEYQRRLREAPIMLGGILTQIAVRFLNEHRDSILGNGR
ncbi:MAG: helix-turn-helix transcriptional regulator [bacterium]